MVENIKLVVTEKSRVIDTVIKETNTQPSNLVKSLEEFQKLANAALTKLIESCGDSGDVMDIGDDEDSDDEEDNNPDSPKKRKTN